jgi:Uma2 family endonuclease
MNVQLPVHMDKTAFLAWVQGREERYELVDGRVVMMTGASRTHGILVLNIAMLLRSQLDPTTVIADFGLDAGPRTLRYPDIMVDRAGGDYTTSDPVLDRSPLAVKRGARSQRQGRGISEAAQPRGLYRLCTT